MMSVMLSLFLSSTLQFVYYESVAVINPVNATARACESANFSCSADGGTILWYMNGQPQSHSDNDGRGLLRFDMEESGGNILSILSVPAVRENDNVSIQCFRTDVTAMPPVFDPSPVVFLSVEEPGPVVDLELFNMTLTSVCIWWQQPYMCCNGSSSFQYYVHMEAIDLLAISVVNINETSYCFSFDPCENYTVTVVPSAGSYNGSETSLRVTGLERYSITIHLNATNVILESKDSCSVSFHIQVDASGLICPNWTLLVIVENKPVYSMAINSSTNTFFTVQGLDTKELLTAIAKIVDTDAVIKESQLVISIFSLQAFKFDVIKNTADQTVLFVQCEFAPGSSVSGCFIELDIYGYSSINHTILREEGNDFAMANISFSIGGGGVIQLNAYGINANGTVVQNRLPLTQFFSVAFTSVTSTPSPSPTANLTATMNFESNSGAVVVIGATAGIIVIIIAAVFGVLILMLILHHRYTRRKMCNGMMVDELVPLPDEKCINVINEEKVVNEASHYSEIDLPAKIEECLKLIPKSAFSQHVREMHKKREKGFEDEYASLPNDSPTDSCESAKMPVNRPKNKFANICPYESSRVKLQHIDGKEGSDYINASYIDGYLHENTYIAAQGPMQNTLTDFWRMIVEHRLTNIVMLTKVVAAGKRKCEQYWPDNPKEYKDFGHGIRVELVSHIPYADYDMRKMIVTQAGSIAEPLEVVHWQFLGWPDHGVPKFTTSLISFIRHVRHKYKKSKTSTPMLVHCSSGVGRTGTFILLDYMLERLMHEDTINIYNFLISMRNRRALMVQTLAQYVFIHDTLDELITCGETDISIHKFKNSIAHLHKQIPDRGITGFESQFKLLEEVCRKPLQNECTDARQTYNDHKNRYSDRLPYDVGRARLKPIGGQGADYINASFIDGYKTRNSYIATQGPLLSTITDFWRMIWEWKSKCIIMLCNLEENSLESSALYWPEKVGEPLKQGNRLVVTLLEENVKKDYVVRKMELKDSTVQGSSFVVTHFHFTEWPENSLPVSCTGLLSMLEEVNRTQRTTGNKPITVMCNDGMGRTGTLICLHVQQERVKTEGVLDVFHFIKSARIQRPKLVKTLEQYIFCHEVIEKFLDMFDDYCNFK